MTLVKIQKLLIKNHRVFRVFCKNVAVCKSAMYYCRAKDKKQKIEERAKENLFTEYIPILLFNP